MFSGEHMQGKVTLEDHFAIEATLGDSQPFGPHVWGELRHRLLDFQDQRLRLMDATGVEIMIASLNAPAIQGIADGKEAAQVARRANDVLAAEVLCRCRSRRPRRGNSSAASKTSDSKARSSTTIRRPGIRRWWCTTTGRNIGCSGERSRASTFPSICIRGRPRSARRSTKATPG